MSVEDFYNDMAEYYDLIFPDWEQSMARQGDAIAGILYAAAPELRRDQFRVLDVSAGIGTQALPLASMGFAITARDLSPGAVYRLNREAGIRGVEVSAQVADMRSVGESVDGRFDAVLALDNSVPHLPDDTEIVRAFEEFRSVLKPGGVVVISIRDYDQVDRTPTSTHRYSEVERDDRKYLFRQEWIWSDALHYQTTLIGEEYVRGAWTEVVRTTSEYYAISVTRLLDLMRQAGFHSCRKTSDFYQPILIGSSPG